MAATYNITIEQGVTFELQFTIKDNTGSALNISGYSFQASVVESTSDTVRGDFTFAITDGANGVVTMTMAAGTTANIPESPTLIWDLIAKDSAAKIHRYLEGRCNVLNPATSTTFS
tara:strand:+ start:1120 stop:1467 length:348 start_codon:yes stop_codon:yes gene_type:complete